MNAGKVILLGLLFCTPLLDLTTASGDDETGNQLGQQAPQASPIFPLQASGSNAPPPAMVSGFFGGPPMPPSGVSSMPPQSSPFGQVSQDTASESIFAILRLFRRILVVAWMEMHEWKCCEDLFAELSICLRW